MVVSFLRFRVAPSLSRHLDVCVGRSAGTGGPGCTVDAPDGPGPGATLSPRPVALSRLKPRSARPLGRGWGTSPAQGVGTCITHSGAVRNDRVNLRLLCRARRLMNSPLRPRRGQAQWSPGPAAARRPDAPHPGPGGSQEGSSSTSPPSSGLIQGLVCGMMIAGCALAAGEPGPACRSDKAGVVRGPAPLGGALAHGGDLDAMLS